MQSDFYRIGDIWQRSKVLELLEAMWNEVDATTIIPTMMHVEGDVLYIGTRRWDLTSMAKFICLVQEKPAMPWQWQWGGSWETD